jgi:hypothetical protein
VGFDCVVFASQSGLFEAATRQNGGEKEDERYAKRRKAQPK